MARPLNYKTYDPAVEGYGNPEEWRNQFTARMGELLAHQVLNGQSPYDVLGISASASFKEIRSAYRAKAFECHPDRIAITKLSRDEADAAFKQVASAYEILESREAAA